MLRVWMPMVNGTSNNQGLTNPTITDTNIVANANGKLGKCCEFNGTDSRILMEGDFGTSVLGGDWTMCMWIYDTRDAARGCYFSTYGLTSGVSGGISLEKLANKDLRVYWNGNPDWTTGFTVQDDEWFHLAVVHRDNNVYVYVNGQLTKSNTAGTFTASKVASYTKAALGRDYRTTTPAHKGYLQDFRLYDTALDDRTIKKISQGLVFHYSLSGGGAGQENMIKESYYDESPWTNANVVESRKVTFQGVQCIAVRHHYLYSNTGAGKTSLFPHMIFEPNTQYTLSLLWGEERTDDKFGSMYLRFVYTDGSTVTQIVSSSGGNHNLHRSQMTSNPNKTVSMITTTYGNGGTTYIAEFKIEKGTTRTPYYLNNEDFPVDTTIEYDLSGNGYHAVKNNITQDFTSPRNVSGGIFNGTNSWVRLENNNWMVQKSPQLTINYWGSSDNWTTYYNRMFSCTEFGGFNCEPGTSGYLRFARHVYTNSAQTSTGYQLTGTDIKLADLEPGYHMFTFVYDTTGSKVYVDGELSNKYDVVSYGLHYNFNSYLYIGCEANGKAPCSPYFNGSINDFRLYYTVLDSDEIKLLYDGNIWETDGGDS